MLKNVLHFGNRPSDVEVICVATEYRQESNRANTFGRGIGMKKVLVRADTDGKILHANGGNRREIRFLKELFLLQHKGLFLQPLVV